MTLDELPDAVREAGGRVELEDQSPAWRFSGEVESFLEVNRLVLERLAAEAEALDDGTRRVRTRDHADSLGDEQLGH